MILMRGTDGYFGDKVFACSKGIRRHIVSKENLNDYPTLNLNDVIDVPDVVLMSLKNGGWLPQLKFESELSINTTKSARDFVSKYIKGSGIEFGAGSSPFPTLPNVTVVYADLKNSLEHSLSFYDKTDIIDVDIVCDVVSDVLSSNTYDFCILCHVIEHVQSPITALKNIYRILKKNGVCILVVPDKNKTFDAKRELTTLDHMVKDYESYSRNEDFMHYLEFYEKVHSLSGQELIEKATVEFNNKGDIHYHTFDNESFGSLINYSIKRNAGFKKVFNYNFNAKDSNEFYYVLIK